MNRFRIAIQVVPRRGLLDPQGKAVADALRTMGFGGVSNVNVGRHLELDVDAADEAEATRRARAMCEQLLANPVTEDFTIASVASA